ncbi:branched-chain amino acid transport system ATP-binding protein [Actinoplanes lutulentus]|uniref:Amino acid/amide ABC transporter ATP-binding protein 2 (HAAT family) n=1 Tax=Actinoplanes lutulentus TaxID=1287878 RepID=A0A327ZK25_9ACTN|nr:ABC transporter ATP-binding protein [Actinoplanes lutulentus]MBB2944156.1 branched-chain amino acid transport system ATP-binding protein [Actinoplanes lutulentus]RAK42611.1 amino acid/amide ABC transporter ATP-binding protein 2 (HAAT family) [Actinoplanes lutulentus]
MTVVEVKSLVGGYLPGIDILNGCDLTAGKGELVGVLGPNGAGKSTLLKAIFGMVRIRSGQVLIGGEDVTGISAEKLVARGVGFVPQNNNVFTDLTLRENLEIGIFQRPKEFAGRLAAVCDLFPDLTARLKQRAGSLSGGQRQTLAMARALMTNPSVLLLDEPSAGLSPQRQDEVFLHAYRISRSGVAVVMVEQNARRCLQICDRAYVLDQGRNAHTGTGDQLMHDPKVIELYLGTLATDVENEQ